MPSPVANDPVAAGIGVNSETLRRAQQLHRSNEPAAALKLARSLWDGIGDQALRIEAGRLVCMSSYRLGELVDAIVAGERTLELLSPGGHKKLRFDVLALLVVAYSDLARYDEAVHSLRQLLALPGPRESLREYARSRSSMAACFALMGDPWTAQRLLGQLANALQAMPRQGKLEAKARVNLAWICLQAARMARDAADPTLATSMLETAQTNLARSEVIATQQGHARITLFSQIHQCEFELLSGMRTRALERVRPAREQAEQAQMFAHARRLRLIHAELLLDTGAAAAALELLDPLLQQLGPGHDLAARVHSFDLAARAAAALGDKTRSVVCMERQRALELYRATRQLQAMSQHTLARLEFEHLGLEDPPASLERATGPSRLEH